MAELASGAVTSLLGVIRNEWRLLGRVGGDVQFIQEEMESMNSFLMHLARTTPPGGEHDEQVRTWMNQVRVLAHDCNNCIDLYLYRGNPDIHLSRDRLRRYIRWVPWFLQKMLAQHRAALELSELKERARDVGKRRLRYGVEVPKMVAAPGPVPGAAPAGAAQGSRGAALVHVDDGGEDGGHDQVWATATDASGRIRRALFGLYVREDYFNDQLTQWIEQVRAQWSAPNSQGQHDTRCVAFLVPSMESAAVARQASAVAEKKHVKNTILVDIPSLHIWRALGPKNVLYYILREIELKQQEAQADAKSQTQPQQQQQQQGQGINRWLIRREKRERIREIKTDIENFKVTEKIKEIKTHIEKVKGNNKKLQPYLSKPTQKEDYITKENISNEDHALAELLVLLLMPSAAADQMDKNNMLTLAENYDVIIHKAANKLKEHMEQVNTIAAAGQHIIHSVTQYEHILHEVFPRMSSTSQPQDAQEKDTRQATTEATPGKIQIREIIDKVKQEILSEVFMAIGDKGQEATKTDTGTTTAIGDKGQEATKTDTTTTTLDEAQVKKMIQEAIQQLKEEKPADKKQETGVSGGQGPTIEAPTVEPNKEEGQPDTGSNSAQGPSQQGATVDEATKKTGEILGPTIKETTKKMKDIQKQIKRQLDINGIVAKIQNYLKRDETLIILKVDHQYVSEWEQTRSALSLLPCIAVVMILIKTETNLERAKEEYCYPKGEPIDYSSLAALYHGIVLDITGLQKSEYNDDAQILRTILDQCESNELCMKIFAHALYAKPKRSKEELHRLHNNLQVLPQKSYHSIAMKMFKFSYRDMPKVYQSCLMYLAIFPRGHKIRRSTVIGRWVAERMITTEDWRWSSSVHIAEQCFDALITRGLVYSAEISATGRVKSCMVGDLAYDFITKMAKKQRIVEPRLSHHLARYFSIFSDLHLRVSDKINDFLARLSESSQWPRLKVLDLEGCRCFKNNRRYLRNICSKIVLLKYLSLRGTDVNWLPREINNLRELEVLDIQQTEVPESFTRGLLLLKLKRLLAGNKNSSPHRTGGIGTSSHDHVLVPDNNNNIAFCPKQVGVGYVLVPEKIEKMLDMEVLSNVKAKSDRDFDDIGKLWQLRKLGVVINIKDKHTHLMNLLKAISNLHECLQSLSITLDATSDKRAPSRDSREPKDSPMVLDNKIEEYPKVLERLSISGNIHIPEWFLPSVLTDKNTPLIKLTLSNTLLRQDNLVALANLHMLRCLKLRHNTYTDNKLTFKEVQFKKLEYFLVEGSNWIEISFEEDTAAPELQKIVLSFDNIKSIARVHHLKKLEELQLNKYNKGSSNSGGITDTTTTNGAPSAPADTSVANPSTLPLNASAAAVVPNTPIGTDPTTSAPTGGAANPSPSPLTASASAVANDHVTNPAPSPANKTADAVNPSPSTQTTSTNHVLIPKLLSDAKQVSKVTLCGTMLKQGDLRALARMENIRCLVLLHESYGERQLDLNKDEFPNLNVLIVSCSTVTEIKFESGSSPKLEKIVWTFAIMNSFSGIGNLTRLKELEFIGDSLPDQVKEDIDKHKDTIHCTHYKPENQDQTVRSTEKGDSVPSDLHTWKDKVWCGRRN